MYGVDVDVHAHTTVTCCLRGRTGDACRSEILDRDHKTLVIQFEARLDEFLLLERVANLHTWPLLLVAFLEGCGREDRCSTYTVLACRVPEENGDVALARCRRKDELVLSQDPERHDIDKGVLRKAVGELDLTTEGRYSNSISVTCDA